MRGSEQLRNDLGVRGWSGGLEFLYMSSYVVSSRFILETKDSTMLKLDTTLSKFNPTSILKTDTPNIHINNILLSPSFPFASLPRPYED